MPPADAGWIAARIRGSKYVELPSAHIANVEQPGAFTQAVTDFLAIWIDAMRCSGRAVADGNGSSRCACSRRGELNLTLDGHTALVTGANGGLGSHFAEVLARAGAKVAIAARRVDSLREVEQRIVAAGGRVSKVALDVKRRESVTAAFDEAASALGPVSVVVNNAGVAVSKPLLEQTEEDWNDVIEVNLNGAWRVAQEAARHMVKHGRGGSIVNIASILGLRVSAQVPAYAASKAALIHLTKAMALELARHRIRVNALAPGYIETSINREFFASDAGQALIKRIPQRRIGEAGELDAALLLLASDAGSYATGSVVVVDGGQLVNTL